MISARTIRREAKHDAILRTALLERLKELHPMRERADMKVFELDSTQRLRERVAAFEQELAQKIMREDRPRTKEAMAQALMRLAQLAGQPLKRHYLAERGEAGFNAKGIVIPGAEAREDSLSILTAGLATQKKEKRTLPIVTDKVTTQTETHLRHRDQYWLINPMDGREHKDVSISIAFIEKGKPLMGITHFPRLDRTYAGIPAEKWVMAQTGKVTRKIKSKTRDQFKRVAAAPHGARKSDIFTAYKRNHDVTRIFGENSAAYGLCRMAQGSFDLYLHHTMLPQASLAAAHAIAIAAGGVVTREDGSAIVYSPSVNTPSAPAFVAASAQGILKHKDNKRLVA